MVIQLDLKEFSKPPAPRQIRTPPTHFQERKPRCLLLFYSTCSNIITLQSVKLYTP